MFSASVFAERHKLQVCDKDSNASVPYVEISTENSIIAICDENGIVWLDIDEKMLYTFSQIGYDPVTIDGKKLLKLKRIQLKEQPMHLSEAVVTADIALYDLKRAMDSTSNLIPKTQYMKNYSLHRVECNGELVLEVKAITVARVIKGKNIGSFNIGSTLVASEKNGEGNSTTLPSDIVDISSINKLFIFINTFLFDTRRVRNDFYFTYLNNLDSNTVISYRRKQGDFGDGRIFLNKEKWTIYRIIYYLPENEIDRYVEYQRNEKQKQLITTSVLGTWKYNEIGNTTSVLEQSSFISRDDDNIKWSLIKTFSYEVISREEYDRYRRSKDTYPKFHDQSAYDLQNLNTHIISENSEKFKMIVEE